MEMDSTRNEEHEYLTNGQAADFLGYAEASLTNMRSEGRGPAFLRVTKKRIRYKKEDLIQWMERNKVASND